MRTVLNGPPSPEVGDLLARRRALGLDTYDEVWAGEYHMNPSPNARNGNVQFQVAELLGPLCRSAGLTPMLEFNLGVESDYRVPDLGALRHPSTATWVDDAALVVEVPSPDDRGFDKFEHFAAFGVVEVMIVDPLRLTVELFERVGDGAAFQPTDRSTMLGVEARELQERIDWV